MKKTKTLWTTWSNLAERFFVCLRGFGEEYIPGGVLMSLKIEPPTVRERNKYEAAAKAGLLERVLEVGWAGLSAKESGKIGGMMAHMNMGQR